MSDECVDQSCPVARAVGILDGKWTMLVIRDLLGGTRRFVELRASLPGISPKTLSERLNLNVVANTRQAESVGATSLTTDRE